MARAGLQQFGGDWTQRKLEALRKYLVEYTKIMAKQPFETEYIDAFAGTGYHELRPDAKDEGIFSDYTESQVGKFLKGSAKIALELQHPFARYTFVELSAEKVTELEALQAQHPALASRITVVNADANQYLMSRAKEDWLKAGRRAVVFVDPFAMEVNWETVASLGRTKAVDLWLLYPISAVNRLLARSGQIDAKWKARLDRHFPDKSWFEKAYAVTKKRDLFQGLDDETHKTANVDSITAYVVEGLRKTFAGAVDNPMLLTTSTGQPLFLLCFASANPKGAPIACRIAKHIVEH